MTKNSFLLTLSKDLSINISDISMILDKSSFESIKTTINIEDIYYIVEDYNEVKSFIYCKNGFIIGTHISSSTLYFNIDKIVKKII